MVRKAFYLMDIENDNGKLRWSWRGFNDWTPIEDFAHFLEVYFPPSWWGIIRKELRLPGALVNERSRAKNNDN